MKYYYVHQPWKLTFLKKTRNLTYLSAAVSILWLQIFLLKRFGSTCSNNKTLQFGEYGFINIGFLPRNYCTLSLPRWIALIKLLSTRTCTWSCLCCTKNTSYQHFSKCTVKNILQLIFTDNNCKNDYFRYFKKSLLVL